MMILLLLLLFTLFSRIRTYIPCPQYWHFSYSITHTSYLVSCWSFFATHMYACVRVCVCLCVWHTCLIWIWNDASVTQRAIFDAQKDHFCLISIWFDVLVVFVGEFVELKFEDVHIILLELIIKKHEQTRNTN